MDILLAVSKKNSEHEKIRAIINRRMKEVITSGEYQSIIDRAYKSVKAPESVVPHDVYNK